MTKTKAKSAPVQETAAAEPMSGPVQDVRELLRDTPTEAHALTTREPEQATAVSRPILAFTPEEVTLIKHQYMPEATDEELSLFVKVCLMRQLNPFTRQIYASKRRQKRNGKWVEAWTYQTSIDGFRLIAERTKGYRGQTAPQWCGPDGVWREVWLESAPPAAARIGILREDFDAPVYGVALWSEYVQTFEDGTPMAMWKKMPSLMLAKVAEALGFRKAFPEELSGLYTEDEMAQAANAERAESRRAAHATGAGAAAAQEEAAADPYAVEPEDITLEQALALPLVGRADSWEKNGQRPLGEVPEKVLRGALKWYRERLDSDDPKKAPTGDMVRKFELMSVGIPMVLDHFDKDQAKLPLEEGRTTGGVTSGIALQTLNAEQSKGTGSPNSTGSASPGATVPSPEPPADGETVGDLLPKLQLILGGVFIPTTAVEHFRAELRNDRLNSVPAMRRAVTLANLCAEIGDELVHADARAKKEVESLLKERTTYNAENLQGILENLRAAHPAAR